MPHGDLLVGSYGASQTEAVATFVAQILSDRLVIAVYSRSGAVKDVQVTEDPTAEHRYATTGEQVSLRFSSGRAWHAETLKP
jgi:hypothetical protein